MSGLYALLAALAAVIGLIQSQCGGITETEKVSWCVSQFEEHHLIQACVKDLVWKK